MTIETLEATFPWPVIKPSITPDDHGWMDVRHEKFFINNIPKNVSLIIELGVWLGKGTKFLTQAFPNAKIISVDHWRGSPEHATMSVNSKLGTLFETFLVNLWDYKSRIIPVRLDTDNALRLLKNYDLKPDVIYVDAGHDYDSVLSDLLNISKIFPDSLILGDDYKWRDAAGNRPVKQAVAEFCKLTGFTVVLPPVKGLSNMTCYRIDQKKA